MFSSLNSVRRNCLKQPRPAALFITFSNDDDQERASSSVGRTLGGEGVTSQVCLIHSRLTQPPAEIFHYLSSQFMVPSDRCSQVGLWTASSSLLTVRLRGRNAPDASIIHFMKCNYNFYNISAANTLSCQNPHRNSNSVCVLKSI